MTDDFDPQTRFQQKYEPEFWKKKSLDEMNPFYQCPLSFS